MDEIIELLGKYCSTGIYGEFFNSDSPSLTDDANMVVLELGGLQDKPSLLVAVMFSLIIYIEDKMYRSDRSLKRCAASMRAGSSLTSKRQGGVVHRNRLSHRAPSYRLVHHHLAKHQRL